MENSLLNDLYKIHAHTLGIETGNVPLYYRSLIKRKNIKVFIKIFFNMYPNINDIEIGPCFVDNRRFTFTFRIKNDY